MARKQLCLLFVIYLAVAVMGSFSFSAAEDFHFAESGDNLTSSGGFLTSVNLTVDCVSENTVTTGKVNKTSSSFPAFPNGMKNTGMYFSASSMQAIKDYHIPIPKNTIPIQLRI